MSVIDAVCSRAFLRSVAILDPRQVSLMSCMLHPIPDATDDVTAPLTSDVSHELTPYGCGVYMDALPGGVEHSPLLSAMFPVAPRPFMFMCVGKPWPKLCLENRPFPPAICDICGTPFQRDSVGGSAQNESPIVPNGDRQVEGMRAPGDVNTFVVFFLFFHLARRFWNQTWRKTRIKRIRQ